MGSRRLALLGRLEAHSNGMQLAALVEERRELFGGNGLTEIEALGLFAAVGAEEVYLLGQIGRAHV